MAIKGPGSYCVLVVLSCVKVVKVAIGLLYGYPGTNPILKAKAIQATKNMKYFCSKYLALENRCSLYFATSTKNINLPYVKAI